MAERPYYYHPPGQLSRWGAIALGQNDTQAAIARIDALADAGFLGCDVSAAAGSAPCLHPDSVAIIARAHQRGLSTRLITNGQYLTGNGILDRLLDAGLTDVLLPYSTLDPALFHRVTGGLLATTQAAMDLLAARQIQFSVAIACTGETCQALPDVARALASRPVYRAQITVEATARYTVMAPHLRAAIEILETEGHIAVTVNGPPLCALAGFEKTVVGITGRSYDPFEAVDADRPPPERGQPSPAAGFIKSAADGTILGRGTVESLAKVFGPLCNSCSALRVCDGVDLAYIQQAGAGELVPYGDDPRGEILDRDRMTYHPAFIVKRKATADVKAQIKRLMGAKPVSRTPLVSIAVANYNNGRYIAKCLDSLLAQTWKAIEIIVVDDASTDNSLDVLAPYRDRCQIFVRSANSGNPAYPHNDAFALAKGELFLYLDPDDWVEATYVEEAVRLLQRHPAAGLVYPGLSMFGMRDRVVTANPYDIHRLIMANFIPCCALYRREVWDLSGGYVYNTRGADDWNLWVAAASLGYFGVPLNRQLFHYFTKPDGLYEQASKPNHEILLKQVIVNNSDAYPPDVIAWAAPPAPPKPATETDGSEPSALADALIAFDTKDEVDRMIAYLTALPFDAPAFLYAIYRLMSGGFSRPAFLLAKILAGKDVYHPVGAFALGVGGILYAMPGDEAQGTAGLRRAVLELAPDQRRMLVDTIVVPTLKHQQSRQPAAVMARLRTLAQVLGPSSGGGL